MACVTSLARFPCFALSANGVVSSRTRLLRFELWSIWVATSLTWQSHANIKHHLIRSCAGSHSIIFVNFDSGLLQTHPGQTLSFRSSVRMLTFTILVVSGIDPSAVSHKVDRPPISKSHSRKSYGAYAPQLPSYRAPIETIFVPLRLSTRRIDLSPGILLHRPFSLTGTCESGDIKHQNQWSIWWQDYSGFWEN